MHYTIRGKIPLVGEVDLNHLFEKRKPHYLSGAMVTCFLMLAAVATGGDILIRGISEEAEIVAGILRMMGGEILWFEDSIRVVGHAHIYSINLDSSQTSKLAKDMRPQLGVLLSLAEGVGTICDEQQNLDYVNELNKLGANAERMGPFAIFRKSYGLNGSIVEAENFSELIALVIAGLAASEETIVKCAEDFKDEYKCLEKLLQDLGAIIHSE